MKRARKVKIQHRSIDRWKSPTNCPNELHTFLPSSFLLSGSDSLLSFFRISLKNDKELLLAHGEEYPPTFSLRYAALKFSQVFLSWSCFGFGFLLLGSASTDLFWQRRNLSFSFLLLKRSKEMEILSNLPDEIPPLSNHCQVTVNRADATLCADWLIPITCCFFLHLIGWEKLSYFS